MKIVHGLIAAGILAASLYSAPASALSLLGGLVNTGSDSGNGSGLVSTNDNGSIGVGGSNGISINTGGLTGGLGGGLGDGTGGSVGVPGVAEISTGSGAGGGTTAGLTLLGGGNSSTSNPLGLLGNGGGLTVSLPGLGGTNGTPGTPGRPGTNGTNGLSGVGGSSGFNGFNGFNGTAGRDGVTIPGNVSPQLRALLAMLAQRGWMQLVNGRAICLSGFGTAEVSSWLPQRDMRSLYSAMSQYSGDIATLRQLLANCRSGAQRQALNVRDLNRVIGIDVGSNGMPVLYML